MGVVLFAYGEFRKDDVLQTVLGRVPAKLPARIRGFRRVLERSTGFYNLVPSRRSTVEGVVMTDLGAEDLLKLDWFEEAAALYYRELHEVETAAGPMKAWVYVRKA